MAPYELFVRRIKVTPTRGEEGKFKMADTLKLGHLIETPQSRDCVHVAIAPVLATERLAPGQHVGLLGNDSVGQSAKPIGIIDPFLAAPVFKGERCWLFLYPGSIQSLRHDWTHEAFNPANSGSKKDSEAWLRDFIERADCPGYETLIAAVVNGSKNGWDDDYLHIDGEDAHGEIPPEFWDHVEIVTGKKIETRPKFFSCSC